MDDTTICDGCGCEMPRANANYIGPELATWEGATLCGDCWASERDRASDGLRDVPPWATQEYEVLGGYLSRNARDQFAFSLQLAGAGTAWLSLHGTFEATAAQWGWRPSEPTFTPKETPL